jgi:hypothetical protein
VLLSYWKGSEGLARPDLDRGNLWTSGLGGGIAAPISARRTDQLCAYRIDGGVEEFNGSAQRPTVGGTNHW